MSSRSCSHTPGILGPILAGTLALVTLIPATARGTDTSSDDIRAYVFSFDDGHNRQTDGEDDDRDEAQEAQRGLDRSLWVRRGQERFLITDEKLLDRAEEIFEPQRRVGRRQTELGRRQGELGRLQSELGRMQGELGRLQASLASKRARLATYPYPSEDELERDRADVRARQQELGALQGELGAMQGALGARVGDLGRQQGELGRQQAQLAREARRSIGELLRDAIASGKAKQL